MYLLRAQGNHRIAQPFRQQEEAAIRSPRATRTCSLRQSRPRGAHAHRVQSSGAPAEDSTPPREASKSLTKHPLSSGETFIQQPRHLWCRLPALPACLPSSRAQLPHAPVVQASSLPPLLFPSLPKSCVPRFQPPPNPADSAPQTPAEARPLRANRVIFFAEKRQDLIRELWLAKGRTRRHIQTRDGVPPFRYVPEHVNFATTVATLFFYQPKLHE